MTLKIPTHPGRIVREDCLPELNLTVGQAAEALGIARQTLDRIIDGRGGITPDMAIRFEKAFGSTAEMWLRMQTTYDLAQARGREAEIVASVRVPRKTPHIKTSQTKTSQTKTSQTKTSQTKTSQTKTSQTKTSQTKQTTLV